METQHYLPRPNRRDLSPSGPIQIKFPREVPFHRDAAAMRFRYRLHLDRSTGRSRGSKGNFSDGLLAGFYGIARVSRAGSPRSMQR